MTDFFNDPKTWFQGLLTFFLGVLTFMFRGYVTKQEDHAKRLELLERTVVTRADLRQMHEENKADIRTLISDIKDLKDTVSHMEGQLSSGRYPRIER